MGFPLPDARGEGAVAGYHCWAEFWIDGQGWTPLDASEAFKHPEKKEALFAGLDENRIEFTLGRDIVIPGSATNPQNFVIYPVVEVDGKKFEQVATKFSFKDAQ
jgi:transglutaminase-like putative cysteine protease